MAAAPFVEAAEGRLLYMVAGEVASIAKTYRRISKYALNMYIDAYIYILYIYIYNFEGKLRCF